MGFFDRIKKIGIFNGFSQLDDEFYDELEESLILSDMGMDTALEAVAELRSRNPASLKLCVLLDKPDRRTQPIQADYVGFTIPDAFVVGYGLDYEQQYRNLPYIGVLKPSVYQG